VPSVASQYGPFEGPNLWEAINAWYNEMYGELMKGIGPITRVPLLIRSQIYLARIPLVYGKDVKCDVGSLIDNITSTLLDSR
jgi:hypothetical protein